MKRIVGFMALSGLLTLCIGVASKTFVLNKVYDSYGLSYEENFKTLILGDSHAQHAFDPGYIEGSMNVALGGEPYFYTYYKLRFLLEHNSITERVILSFSYLNLAPGQTKKLYEENSQFTALFDRYFMLLDADGLREICKLENRFNSPFLTNVLKYRYGFPINGLYREIRLLGRRTENGNIPITALPFIGGFVDTSESDVREYVAREMERHKAAFLAHEGETAQLMVKYLKKIAFYCERRGVKLILVNTPIQHEYSGVYPKKTRDSYHAVLEDLKTLYPSVVFLDYERFDLPDEQFQNGHHLNKYGAEVFSREINSVLKAMRRDSQNHGEEER